MLQGFKHRYWLVLPVIALPIVATATHAKAQTVPDCSSLNLPHPIYGSGGSAVTADLQKVATALSGLSSPITILYSDPSACPGFTGFLNGNVTGTFKYWTADGVQHTCNPPLTGQAVDFAHMGNTAEFCPNVTVSSDVGDFTGPIQTLNIVAVPSSSQQAISAEALYFIYGFGATGQAAPWTNPAHIVQRSPTSFAQLFLAAAIGVPYSAFKGGVTAADQATVISNIVTFGATSAEDPLGFVSGSAADKAAGLGQIKTLAYKAKGQLVAYWPDSTPTALDKVNVRTGQYGLWTPGHFFARINPTTKAIVNADVANLIGWYNGTVAPPSGIDVVGLTIDAGDIPQCAMRVTREGTYGAISSWAPPEPCGCYFEKRATGKTACTACSADSNCSAPNPKCRSGYCEAY